MSALTKMAATELQESEMYLIGFLSSMGMNVREVEEMLASRFDMHISPFLIGLAADIYNDHFPEVIRMLLYRYAVLMSQDFYDYAMERIGDSALTNNRLRAVHCTAVLPVVRRHMLHMRRIDEDQAFGVALGELQSALGCRSGNRFYATHLPFQMWYWWDTYRNRVETPNVSCFRTWLNDSGRGPKKLEDYSFLLRNLLPEEHPQKNVPWAPMLEYVFQFIGYIQQSNPLDLLSVTQPVHDAPVELRTCLKPVYLNYKNPAS